MIESRTIVRFALNYVVVFDKYCEWGSFPTPANRNLALGKIMASWALVLGDWEQSLESDSQFVSCKYLLL